jgi:acetyl esterase
MALDPQVRALLERMAGRPALNSVPVAVGRQAYIDTTLRMIPRPSQSVRTEDRDLAGPGGPLPIRIYRPLPARSDRALVVYFHGGGWVVCNLETHDALCRRLALGADAVVVSVDYRLAPEHRFPAAPDDCVAATRWALAQAASLDADPRRAFLAGDSAGGNLAAAVALQLRDEGGPTVRGQLLVYPVTDHPSAGFASYAEFAEGFGLTREVMVWFWDLYLGASLQANEAAALSPRAAPLRAGDLGGLPPALVLTAEYDVLRDEGEAYAQRLREAGNPVQAQRFAGMHHGFFNWGGVLDGADRALAHACAWLRQQAG